MTIQLNAKNIVSTLDSRAMNADMAGGNPASGKQCWFLATLIEKHNDVRQYEEIILNSNFCLSKAKASKLIDMYLND